MPARTPATSTRNEDRAAETRQALVTAAAGVFARDGFAAASTRAIAQAAGVNLALINYHFGGKDGLYLAVFDHIAERLSASRGTLPPRAELLASLRSATPEDGRERAVTVVEHMLIAHLRLLMQPGMDDVARLVVREQLDPGPAFERLWNGVLSTFLGLLTDVLRYVADLDGTVPSRQRSAQARLLALSLIGQCLVFRVARATVVRHLDWRSDTPTTVQQRRIEQLLASNIRCLLGQQGPVTDAADDMPDDIPIDSIGFTSR